MTTKQRILDTALTLFAEKGYDAVSVGQIAEAVGIKAPSLYKHYKSKQHIFQAILAEMEERYRQQAAAMQMNGSDAVSDAKTFARVSEENLIQMGTNLFSYFLHDAYVARFRKMLTLEQYHNKELAAFYTAQYVDEPLSYQGMLMGLLSQAGVLKAENAQIMAMHFYAPMYLLLTLCDRLPEREAEAMRFLEEHIRQFNRIYKREERV